MQKISADIGWNLENSYARLPERFYARVLPEPVPDPKLVVLNRPLASALGLDADALQSDEGVAILAGNQVPDDTVTLAQSYAGHQFGHFTMLGDGRAVLIGEQITPEGDRFDIQLKGSGRTPFSRGGDGRAALGPMLREYIVSEAMHALGIPTTRSLAVVSTGAPVIRESVLPGAVLTRVAASHMRVGTFQFAAARGSADELKALADYALARHFPDKRHGENPYLHLLNAVIERQAALIAKWQGVGFIHGVMNTDNMAISGETIDYGPCAFMDAYDPATVFSSIDDYGRYAYGNQPPIAQWNLARFAETLLPLLHEDTETAVDIATEAVTGFSDQFKREWLRVMRAKLGLCSEQTEDESLIQDLLSLMKQNKADFTNTFRALTQGRPEECGLTADPEFAKWHERWRGRITSQPGGEPEARSIMKRSNPAVIPRNHRVEEALSAAVEKGDLSVMERLLDVLSKPFAYSSDQVEFAEPPPPSPIPYRTFCGT